MSHRAEIADALEGLAVHCKPPLMEVSAKVRWIETWCEDLVEFPIEAILAACKLWRQGDSTKFPTPGQLLPIVRRLASQGNRSERETAWTWLDHDQLDRMTLRERRRQYLIMGFETRSKVGPMGEDGSYPRPEFLQTAADYYAEANALRARLAAYAQDREGFEN